MGRAQEALHRRFRPLGEQVMEAFREFSTEHLMRMDTPSGNLRLGEDLPAARGKPLFPRILSPIEQPELRLTLRRFGAAGDGRRETSDLKSLACAALDLILVALRLRRLRDIGSAASDWSELSQRMRFIFAYFRSRQHNVSLLQPPFDADQTVAIIRGMVPSGEL